MLDIKEKPKYKLKLIKYIYIRAGRNQKIKGEMRNAKLFALKKVKNAKRENAKSPSPDIHI